MRYPLVWRKFNTGLAFVSGGLAFVIALLSAWEAINRYFFHNPSSWNLNVCCYLLVWCIFLGSSYSLQEHGHVGVDLIRDLVDKVSKKRLPRRVMAIVGYLLSLAFLLVLLDGVFRLCKQAIQYNQETTTSSPLPLIWLYSGILIGTILMIITAAFILIDLFTKSEDYL